MAESFESALRSVQNATCSVCTPDERALLADGGICDRVRSELDGLRIRCVGSWAYQKVFHLYQYFGIFAGGMKNKWGLNYVEICSGPGRCVFKETGEEVDGSALAIVGHEYFQHVAEAIFVDNDPQAVEILNHRLAKANVSDHARAVVGDYTDVDGLVELLQSLPSGNLNLVFVDPTDCSVPFAALEAIISHLKYVDFIINVPVHMDVGRNLSRATLDSGYQKSREKYARAIGDASFFSRDDVKEMAARRDSAGLRAAFRDAYLAGLHACGHTHTAERTIYDNSNHPLYELLFASRDAKGLEFWEKACRIDPSGQRQLL